jgi:hypothetical protein
MIAIQIFDAVSNKPPDLAGHKHVDWLFGLGTPISLLLEAQQWTGDAQIQHDLLSQNHNVLAVH